MGVELGAAVLSGDFLAVFAFVVTGWRALEAAADSMFTAVNIAGLPVSIPVRTAKS
jgi:hypothetical protein